ncbi:uncharacterized protein Triagg1_9446 [Trichoderma aggressivum f. europaeum]|uniref:Uncharacterized protein n=1 Tax=Trichoderma aggressivum f. europaeum TaxID=173218 RepID=A0AAE1I6J3_9HYPO|nr:hypothetical protein Triagg1_9446 [Trichoderma aggressivum f. europaeum]
MGKADKQLKAFIENIPDSSLTALPTNPGTLHKDTNFRLDMQGMTKKQEHNLQVQVNKGTTITSLKKVAPKTVAGPVLVKSKEPSSAADIRAELLAKMLI